MRLSVGMTLIWMSLLVSPINAQRVSASGIRTDDGFVWHNGTGPTQWLRLRATNASVPPRTARLAWATQIQVTEGGDPFGRVALLWSGWEGAGGNDSRTEYWLKCGYKSPPIYEAAHLYDTFNCGDGTFKGRLWNEQYFSWQPRSLEASLFINNAPLPTFANFQPPSWIVPTQLDLYPNRPGIQIDPLLTPRIEVIYRTGRATVQRPLLNFPRAVGADAYTTDTRPSPFRDRVTRSAVATVKINNNAPQVIWNNPTQIEWAPLDGTVDRVISEAVASYSPLLRNYPVGTIITLTYQVGYDRIPFNKLDQPLSPPAREPIDDLRDGQNLNFDLKGLNYSYSGAVSGGGQVGDGDAPAVCVPKQPGTLNITLNLRDFIPDLPFDLVVTLSGSRVDADTVRWTFDVSPNRCVNINGVNALVKRIWGQLTATLQPQSAFLDSECGLYYNLRLIPEGGDAGNWINAELYALCFENAAARVNVAVRNIDYVAYGGGVFQQNDPRVLYRGIESQVIELVRYGDVNGDACVDDADLLEVLFNFGARGSNRADLNSDGIVDDADLLIVLFAFGNGC